MSPSLFVACLCAAWCRTCDDYAPLFEAQAAASGADSRWVDIEDHEDALDGVEVENFPTLLVAQGDEVLFYGPVLPHPQTLQRLLQAAREGDLHTSDAPAAVAGVPSRLRRLPR